MPQIGTKGGNLDLLIRQGATLMASVVATNPDGSPIDLTGATITAQIRKLPSSVTAECSATIVLTNPTAGTFTFEFVAADTADLTASDTSETSEASTYVWDLEVLDAAGKVTPLLYGNVYVWREVTKA
jgi:hypothetical protein